MKAAAQPVSARRVRERSPVASRFCHNRHPQTVKPIAMTANRRMARYLIGQWFDGLVTHSSLRIETKQSLPGERFRSHRAGTGTVRTHRSVRYGCIAYMLACLLANVLCDICKYSFMFFCNYVAKIMKKSRNGFIFAVFLSDSTKKTQYYTFCYGQTCVIAKWVLY